jgi:hypothetical protein
MKMTKVNYNTECRVLLVGAVAIVEIWQENLGKSCHCRSLPSQGQA